MDNDVLDPWVVLGLHAATTEVTLAGILKHHRLIVLPHVFERDKAQGLTHGPRVPKWLYANVARDMLDTEEKVLGF